MTGAVIVVRKTVVLNVEQPILSIIIGKKLLFPKSEKFKNKTGIIINILFKCVLVAMLVYTFYDTLIDGRALFIPSLIIFLVSILLDILVLFEERKKAKELK